MIREAVTLAGHGPVTSKAYPLAAGRYAAEYDFPSDVLTLVALARLDEAEEHVLFVRSGSGAVEFALDAAGRCVLRVDPADPSARWRLVVRPLGLPSAAG